jgi:hypothetical protein
MSDYQWCHGPKCHTNHTQDRIRGVQGSKVLRTKKIKVQDLSRWHYSQGWENHFCRLGCLMDFIKEHINELIRLHPRTEPLETKIDVVIKDVTDWRGNPYKQKVIQAIDNA